MTTRYTVAVKLSFTFRRRKYLFLLPGTRWEVVAVEGANRISSRPTYRLRRVGEKSQIVRAEGRLRSAGGL